MPDFSRPTQLPSNFRVICGLGTNVPCGLAMRMALASYTSSGWATANKALYVPFDLESPAVALNAQIELLGTTAGHGDVGIYDAVTKKLLVSDGGTAFSVLNGIQVFNFADTELPAGHYYFAFVMDTTSMSFIGQSANANMLAACGVKEEASAYPLPATCTPVDVTMARMPQALLSLGAVIN